MSMPSIEEIMSLYLYGQSSKPSATDLLNDQWIRGKAVPEVSIPNAPPNGDKLIIYPAITNGAIITLDQTEYMTNGPGRFASPEKFSLINKFLNGEGNIPVGIIPYADILDPQIVNYSFSKNDLKTTIFQYVMGVTDSDFAERAYVHGTTGFKIVGGDFIVNPDNTREIRNLEIKSFDDNFDYDSISAIAQFTNYLTKEAIDPSGIGRSVSIKFNNANGAIYPLITRDDIFYLHFINGTDNIPESVNTHPARR